MTFYELILLIHIAAAITWIGTGFGLLVLATRADRARDDAHLGALFADMGGLANTLFIPASLTVLAAGIVLTIDSWSFGDLWIVLALFGYAATFVTGAFFLGPSGEKIGAQIAADGGPTPATVLGMRRVLTLARLDYIVLISVVVLMVLKPTGDDVGVLIALAAFVAAGAFWVISSLRALDAGGTPATAAPAA